MRKRVVTTFAVMALGAALGTALAVRQPNRPGGGNTGPEQGLHGDKVMRRHGP